MGYIDRYYFGQAKLIVQAPSGKSVSITDGVSTWTGTTADKKAEFILPGTSRYVVTIDTEDKQVFLDYGDCQKVDFN